MSDIILLQTEHTFLKQKNSENRFRYDEIIVTIQRQVFWDRV